MGIGLNCGVDSWVSQHTQRMGHVKRLRGEVGEVKEALQRWQVRGESPGWNKMTPKPRKWCCGGGYGCAAAKDWEPNQERNMSLFPASLIFCQGLPLAQPSWFHPSRESRQYHLWGLASVVTGGRGLDPKWQTGQPAALSVSIYCRCTELKCHWSTFTPDIPQGGCWPLVTFVATAPNTAPESRSSTDYINRTLTTNQTCMQNVLCTLSSLILTIFCK